MDWESMYATASSLWVVWFTALFVGICVWALRPDRRAAQEEHARIPLREDE
jgi:cytochrome c oxidase cbb3-type subunit 4